MARRQRKNSSSVFGAIVIEGFALIIFVFLFVQAKTERQKETGWEQNRRPVIQEMFQQNPRQDLLAQGNVWTTNRGEF